MPLLRKSHDSILHVSNAEYILDSNKAVTLVLTRQALLIVNVAEDSVEKIFPLKDLIAVDHPSEPTMLRLYSSTSSPPQYFRKVSPVEQVEVHVSTFSYSLSLNAQVLKCFEKALLTFSMRSRTLDYKIIEYYANPYFCELQMDQEMRARVAEFLRTSSTGLASVSTNSDAQSEIHDTGSLPRHENSLIFYINSDSRSYLLSVFNVAKRQSQENGFAVL
jgi:vacuolar protein sorting-associated protein 13B